MKNLNYFLLFLICLTIVFLLYKGLFGTFYQQDEWNTFGHIQANGLAAVTHDQSVIEILGGGGRPLSFPFHYIFYTYFPFNLAPFVVFAIFFHALNTFLLYLLSKKLTGNNVIAGLASLFFIFASTSHQAITWVSATTTTLPAATFSLLTLLSYMQFVEKRQNRFMYTAAIFFVIAFFFKESSVFLFLLLPLLYVLYSPKKAKLTEVIKSHSIFIFFASIVILLRVYALFFINQGLTTGFVTRNEFPVERIVLHAVMYPLSSLSQLYIYPSLMWPLAGMLNILSYPRISSETFAIVVTETIGSEFISIMISLFLLFVLYQTYKKLKQYRKALIFSLTFTLLSFLPYVILDKSTAYLESRYFYVGEIGAGLLFSFVVYYVYVTLLSRFPARKRIILGLLGILLVFYFKFQVQTISSEITSQIAIASERQNLISQLNNYKPSKSRNVYFISGNRDFYTPGNKLPFTQGIGFTLMVLYSDSGLISRKLLNENFLWNLKQEGYAKTEAGGFGYYATVPELAVAVKTKQVDLNNVVALYYDADNKSLINITESLKNEIVASLSASTP